MSEAVTTSERIEVFSVCELFAWIFAGPPVEDYYHGAPIGPNMIAFFVIGVMFALAGPLWPWLKPQLPERFAQTLVSSASDFRVWIVLLLFYFTVASFSSFGNFAMKRELFDLRKDVNHYAMPRHLTDAQMTEITKYLSDPSRPPQRVSLNVISDREAGDFATDIAQALEAAHWSVDVNPGLRDADFMALSGGELQGLFFREEFFPCVSGQIPITTQLLAEAMADAKVHEWQGGNSGCAPHSSRLGVRIMVGYRPRTWHPEMKEVPAEE